MSKTNFGYLKKYPTQTLEKILAVIEGVEELLRIAPDSAYAHGDWRMFEKRGVNTIEAQNIVHKWITEDGVEMKDNNKFSVSIAPPELEFMEALKKKTEKVLKQRPDAQKNQRRTGMNTTKTSKPLIFKDMNGDYFYNGMKMDVPRHAMYFRMFEILFSKADQSGFVPYETFEKEFSKGFPIIPASRDAKKRNKRISNAFSDENGLFRYAKVNGKLLTNKTPAGEKLIEIIKGAGVKLNNQAV